MAEIFLAAQPGPAGFERFLVIKRILPAFTENEEFVRMFLDEMRLAARLSHPNIGHIYDFGVIDDLYFIAMELIDGVNLRQLILRGHPLPLEHVVRIIAYVCEALHYAHTLNDRSGSALEIVHRDVTPQNVMVAFEGGVKLVDFGIAKASIQAEQTQAGVLKGKFSYMSPEQIRGKTLDARSDVFSVGVLLYELVTGARLFTGETATDTMDSVTRCQVPRMDAIRASLPPGLAAVVDRAVVADPTVRYQNARELQLDLEHVILDGKLMSNSILIAEYLQAIFPERKAEARGSTVTGLLLDDQHTQADGAPPVLPEGWDTNLRTQLADPPSKPRQAPAGGAMAAPDGTAETSARPGQGLGDLLAQLPARTVWYAAAGLAAILVFVLTSVIVSALRSPPVIASEPLEPGELRGVPLLPPPPPRIADAPRAELPPPPAVNPPAGAPFANAPAGTALVLVADRPAQCEVLLDGEALAADTREVAPGRHMVTTQGGGCEPETVELVLSAGDIRTITPRAATATPEPPAPAPRQVQATPPNPRPAPGANGNRNRPANTPAAEPRPAAGEGHLDLRTRPWAKVYDGGRFLGVSPLHAVRLSAGARTLLLKNPDVGTKRLSVNIRAGRSTTVSVDLSRLR
jgi:serine/threonine-protein kinase